MMNIPARIALLLMGIASTGVQATPTVTYYHNDLLGITKARKMNDGLRLFAAKISAWLALLVGITLPAFSHAGTITYYHNDLLGSPVVATNASGQVIWRESYRPYGERLTNDPASGGNKIWFTSRRQDAETGLVYMGARYYDPVMGRFLSTDSKGFDDSNIHSFNRYAYANNSPYRYVDPNGRESIGIREQERMQVQYLKGNISQEQLNDFNKAQASGAAIGVLFAAAIESVSALMATTAVDGAIEGATYKTIDGVRRSKAAELSGKSTIKAEIEGAGRQTAEIPIDALRSPKDAIETAGPGAKRWTNILEGTRDGADLPPILVRPGSTGIPIRDVKIQ